MIDGGGDDAGVIDGGGPGCGLSPAAPVTVAFDGVDDFNKFPAGQTLVPGAQTQPYSRFALAWDADHLYVTMVSEGFEDEAEPVHVYVQAGTGPLGTPVPSTGKEYDSLVAALSFTPTHVIAVRRTNDLGGGPYNAIYTPGNGFTDVAAALLDGVDTFTAADLHTLSAEVALADLGCPTQLRLAAHVVHAEAGNEWKETVPADHTPWMSAATGHYDIDLAGAPEVTNWSSP